jgi:hypothetical protein
MERRSYKFDSVGRFSAFLDRPVSKETYCESSMDTGRAMVKACNTESFQAAENLMKFGDYESLKKIQAVNVDTKKVGEITGKMKMDLIGSSVSVGAYLSGKPNCFRRIVKAESRSPIIKVGFCPNFPWGASAEKITEISAFVFACIESLEKKGYRVELDILAGFADSFNKVNLLLDFSIRLKNSDSYINRAKLAYFLINPSFLRRHLFRAIETENNLPIIFRQSYGYCVPKDTIQKVWAKEYDILIDPLPWIKEGANIKDSVLALFNRKM